MMTNTTLYTKEELKSMPFTLLMELHINKSVHIYPYCLIGKFFDDAKKELNLTFDLDVCSPAGGLPWIPAKKSLSIIDDGLTFPWHGNVWCNPPYSGIKPWIN